MQKIKCFLLLLVFFFAGVISVQAAAEGVSDTTRYVETDKRTNYIKLELHDGNLLLFQIDSSNSALARQFKDYIYQEHYDNVSVGLTPGIFEVNQGNFEGLSCNFNNFKTPVYGDLIAIYDEEECAVSSFQIYALERGENKMPVIGHLIAGSGVLQNGFTSIKSIRFVNISQESSGTENGENSGGGSSEGTNTGSDRVAVTSYCSDDLELLKTFKFIGRILSVVKILIPLIIIILGVIDFFRAVIASKDDEIKKSMKSLMFRAISGVIIFFLPTIINLIFMLVDDWGNYRTDYSVCSTCVTNPSKCKV